MSNVVQMVRRSDKARSRGREEALSVIVPRLRELMLSGAAGRMSAGRAGELDVTTNQVGNLHLRFMRPPAAAGIYFSISEGGQRHMTGYLDPVPPGRYLGGKVHIMSWKRGEWESRLF